MNKKIFASESAMFCVQSLRCPPGGACSSATSKRISRVTGDVLNVASSSFMFCSTIMSNAFLPLIFLSFGFDPFWRRSFTTCKHPVSPGSSSCQWDVTGTPLEGGIPLRSTTSDDSFRWGGAAARLGAPAEPGLPMEEACFGCLYPGSRYCYWTIKLALLTHALLSKNVALTC